MSARPTLTVFRGLSGCGKSTAARQMLADAAAAGRRLARSNRDCLRDLVHPGCYQHDATEDLVTAVQHAQLGAMLGAGWSVVCDDTNLRPATVRAFRAIAAGAAAAFEIIDMTGVPLDVCIARDAGRPDRGYPPTRWEGARTGADVIRGMHARHLAAQTPPATVHGV